MPTYGGPSCGVRTNLASSGRVRSRAECDWRVGGCVRVSVPVTQLECETLPLELRVEQGLGNPGDDVGGLPSSLRNQIEEHGSLQGACLISNVQRYSRQVVQLASPDPHNCGVASFVRSRNRRHRGKSYCKAKEQARRGLTNSPILLPMFAEQ
jgi:hypothetical protein